MKYIAWGVCLLMIFSCNGSGSEQPINKAAVAAEKDGATDAAAARGKDSLTLYREYCNARYQYCLNYPSKLLIPQPESENGDGRVFLDQKGNEIVRVYGSYYNDEADAESIAGQYRELLKEGEGAGINRPIILEHQLQENAYLVSWQLGGRIFYQKGVLKQDAIATLLVQFEESAKVEWEQPLKQLLASFH